MSSRKMVLLCNEFWADLVDPGVDRERMEYSKHRHKSEPEKQVSEAAGLSQRMWLIGGCAKIVEGKMLQ